MGSDPPLIRQQHLSDRRLVPVLITGKACGTQVPTSQVLLSLCAGAID
ncbi:MAG: hypothetical protein KME26_32045 [Oscillatoria princeps RMCB-10]|nr:hypothetical protein [Oscillatoria princeps RMCB-10]